MSRETRKAIDHPTPMTQRSESGVSACYETKVFFGIGQRGVKVTPSPVKLLGNQRGSAGGIAKPSDGAILLESVRVALHG